MAAGAWVLVNTARTNLVNGTFDLDSDTFKIGLVTSASNIAAGSTTWAGVSGEVSSTNTGYTTGGIGITLALSGSTSVKVTTATSMVWTAGSANLVAKWAVIYEVSGNVLCYCLLDSGGADVTTLNGNTLTITMNANGIFTIA